MNKFLIIIWVHIMALPASLYTQNASEFFGKMKKSDFPKSKCEIDTTASAYYLFDRGAVSFMPANGGWKMIFQRHFRIKIDSRAGVKEGNITLWLHSKGNEGKEELTELRGTTYNLENKKWNITKYNETSAHSLQNLLFRIPGTTTIPPGETIHDDATGDWKKIDIRLPNVKPGSVIELFYTIESDLFFEMENWSFQKHIPVLESKFSTSIPQYFLYTPYIFGENQVKKLSDVDYNYDFGYNIVNTTYVSRSLPSTTQITHVRNIQNYIPSVTHEFVGFNYNGKAQSFEHTWPDLNKSLLSDTSFGAQLKNCTCFNDKVSQLQKSTKDTLGLINLVYQFIQSHIRWNGNKGISAEIPIDSVFKYGEGTAAEINLAMICMLNKLGLSARPVLISTVDHGYVLRSLPSLKWFDYTIALLDINTKKYLVDAADPFGTVQLLSPSLINGYGLLVDTTVDEWVEIVSNGVHQTIASYQLDIEPEKGIKGKYRSKQYQYAAYEIRKKIAESGGDQNYLDNQNYTYQNISLYNAILQNPEDPAKEVSIDGDLLITNQILKKGSALHWVPLQYERIFENPFKENLRVYPVEFLYPISQVVSMEIKVPAGYKIVRLPKSVRYADAGNVSRYSFVCDLTDSTIKINSSLNIRTSIFTSEEYEGLKRFYQLVVDKMNEEIVMEKE